MKKIEQLEESIEEYQEQARVELDEALTVADEEYSNGYLDALQDVVNAIEGVWEWTRLAR
ncbi:hypothetical protein QP293_26055 [Escherichia coli]|nr:hypothetical protein [Escherichia coli]